MTESHEFWAEVAAAHALHSLEPDEEARLLAHVGGCASCRAQLDEFTLVAAQLGSLSDDDVQPPAWAAVRPGSARTGTSSLVLPMPRRARRRATAARLLAAAAAVVLAAGVVAGWQFSRPGPSAATAALAACRHQTGCQVIRLHGQRGDNADVLVVNGTVSLVPVKLPAPADGRVYVLWQLPRDGSPMPVVSVTNSTRQTATVSLPTAYADTAAFALSIETAGPMPTRPTEVLAVGAASST